MSTPKIVISYRRSSFDAIAGRIRDKLVDHYGSGAVYMDVDDIPFGVDFRKHIDGALNEGDVVVAIIGPRWLGPRRRQDPRIFDEADPVRIEIEVAIRRGIAVVPILVEDATMPRPDELPETIRNLAFYNAATVDSGRDFHQHMERVIRSMNLVLKAPVTTDSNGPQLPVQGRKPIWVAAAAVAVVALTVGVASLHWAGVGPPAPKAVVGDQVDEVASKASVREPVPMVDVSAPIPKASDAARSTSVNRTTDEVAGGRANLGSRVALVIGTSKYAFAPAIANTVNDSLGVSDLFRSMGFSVITQTNVSLKEFNNAMRTFQEQAARADVAAIYFAGHAVEVSGINYLMPIDAKLSTDAELRIASVSLNALLESTQGAHQLRLVLLDACRDDPFARPTLPTPATKNAPSTPVKSKNRTMVLVEEPARGVSGVRSLALIKVTPPNTLIAYAAEAGEVALDGDGDHGPFAAALIKHLGTPGLDIRIALGRVRDEVFRSTSGRQRPFVYGSLGGDSLALVPNAN